PPRAPPRPPPSQRLEPQEENMKFLKAIWLAVLLAGPAYAHDDDWGRHNGDTDFRIEVLSSRPYMVSGGDALVRISVLDRKGSLASVRVDLTGRNVTSASRPDAGARTPTGLVTGLRQGANRLEVDAKGRGVSDADITLTNYSIKGPIISGPQEFP